MLDLTNGGKTCSGLDAVDFMESLADIIPEESKTDEFCEQYEDALNRLRWYVQRFIPVPVRDHPHGKCPTYPVCGVCGYGLQPMDNYCPNCGRPIDNLHHGKDDAK